MSDNLLNFIYSELAIFLEKLNMISEFIKKIIFLSLRNMYKDTIRDIIRIGTSSNRKIKSQKKKNKRLNC